jgi:hypothetical protein
MGIWVAGTLARARGGPIEVRRPSSEFRQTSGRQRNFKGEGKPYPALGRTRVKQVLSREEVVALIQGMAEAVTDRRELDFPPHRRQVGKGLPRPSAGYLPAGSPPSDSPR